MVKRFTKKLAAVLGVIILLFPVFSTIRAMASTSPSISVSPSQNSTYNITVNFPSYVPAGNIIDIELYNSSNQKVWQYFTTNGGTSASSTTNSLPQGSYTVEAGLFTPNWSSNYAWYSSLYTLNVSPSSQPASNQPSVTSPTPTPSATGLTSTSPTQNIAQNSTAMAAAGSAYNSWRSVYVQQVNPGVLRVVRPENNNDTVSEGIGYGMLLSYFAGDETTFKGLWSYGQRYLDSKGLMNWQIDSSGNVIGQGSATDADEDMAYALLRADSKWPNQGFGQGAKNLINAMLNTEVQSSNLINPGDNWGTTQIMNPSYLAPAYYRAFAAITGDSRWNTIADTNLSWEQNAASSGTGLIPDWLNANFSQPSISWDQYPDAFYYDAVRAPIRLLMDYKWNNSQTAANILNKENAFVSGVGVSNLKSGYSLTGSPLTNYIDSTFLSAYASMGQTNSSSQFASDSLNALITNVPNNYFGASLRALALYVIAGAN